MTPFQKFEEACNEFVEYFVEEYHRGMESTADGEHIAWYWIGEEVGGVVCVHGVAPYNFYHSLGDIVEVIRSECTPRAFFEYYWYASECYDKNEAPMLLTTYLKEKETKKMLTLEK